nr:hypothetical protein [Micromonospora sp. KC721]
MVLVWLPWTRGRRALRCGVGTELIFAILACKSEPVDPRL